MATDGVRRLAALAALPLLAAALFVTVLTLYRNIPSLALGVPGLAILVVSLWWLVVEVGVRRLLGGIGGIVGVAMTAVALVMVLNRPERWVLRTVIILGLLLTAFAVARFSLTRPVHERAAPRPRHPVLLCNLRSGGGKVEQFGLVALAEQLGVEVVVLEPGTDLEQLTRAAVARGADCLGMAGGDGSQALVASVAVEHDLPFVCIPAGTRNHFALDLGLDRDDPRAAMSAFTEGVERRVDYATCNDRLFVNNVSLGVYATIVQSEDYRDAKVDVSLSMLSELLGRQSEPFDLQYRAEDGEVDGAFVVMVSNNRYVLGAARDAAQRRVLDSGTLGVFAVSTRTGVQAARLVTLAALGLRSVSRSWHEFAAETFEVRSRGGSAFLGIDGEALEAATPLRFRSHPAGLRMLVPPGNLAVAERRRARSIKVRDVAAVALGRPPSPA